MKRYFAIFLAFVLIFSFTFIPFSYADDTITQLENVDIGDSPDIEALNGTGSTSDLSGYLGTDAVSVSGIFATILTWPLSFLEKLFDTVFVQLCFLVPTIDGCIFNTQNFFKLSFFDANPDGLAGSLQGTISAIYNALRYLVTAAYIVTLVYLAIRMMLSSVGRRKAYYKELFKHWLVGLLLLFSFHWIMAFIIWLSNTFVEILAGFSANLLDGSHFTAVTAGVTPQQATDYPITSFIFSRIFGLDLGGGLLAFFGPLKKAVKPILAGFLLCSSFSIVMTYFKRLFTIAILIVTFPLVALSYVFDKIGDRKAQTLSIWFKEFTVNVMIQPIHAIVLLFIAMIFSTGTTSSSAAGKLVGGGFFGPHILGAVMSIAALRLIPVGENLLKKLFQINSSMGPGSQGIAGSMARAGMAFNGLKSMAGGLKKAGSGVKNLRALKKYGNDKWKESEEGKAFKGSKAEELARKREFLKGNSDYKKFKDDMCERMGVKNMAGAYTLAAAQAGSALVGVGTSITGAESGKFLSDAAYKTSALAELSTAAVQGVFKGDVKDAKDAQKRADELDKLKPEDIDKDKELQKKIAADLGINVKLVNGKNKDLLVQSYRNMAIAARGGVPAAKLKEFTAFNSADKKIKDKKMPDGSGPLDYKKFSNISQTGDGVFGEYNGHIYQLSSAGNPKLKDGESISVVPSLAGKSIKGSSETLMRSINDPEYAELARKKALKGQELSKAKDDEENARKELEKAKDFESQRKNIESVIESSRSSQKKASARVSELHGKMQDVGTDISTIKTALSEAKAAYTADPSVINGLNVSNLERDLRAKESAQTTLEREHSSAKADVARFGDELIRAQDYLDDFITNPEYKDILDVSAASATYDNAKKATRSIEREVSRIDSSMEKITDREIQQHLSFDEARVEMGLPPQYAETAFKTVASNPSLGTIHQGNNGASVTYNTGNGAPATYTINNTSGADVTYDYDSEIACREYVSNHASDTTSYNAHVTAGQTYAAACDSYRSGTISQAELDAAKVVMQNQSAQTHDAFLADVSAFSADPKSAKDASQAVSDCFSFNQSIRDTIGTGIIGNIEPPADNGFDYGVCPALTDLLSMWDGSNHFIELTRGTGNTLHYSVRDAYRNTEVASGDIDVGDSFSSDGLSSSGDHLTISHNSKGAWFHK